MNTSGRTIARAMVMIACASSAPLVAADYRYVRIDPPNSVASRARGVNARGDVVGVYDDANGVGHGYLLRDGVFTDVVSPGGVAVAPRMINARGDIVGSVFGDSGDHGFLLTAEGLYTEIDYPGAAGTQAFGVNNAGDITGRYFDEAGHENGFIRRNGVFSRVRLPDSCLTDVYGAQDNGRVLTGDFCTRSDGGRHGFVRDPTGFTSIDFPNQPFPCTFARAINERGDVGGFFATVNTSDECNSGPPAEGFFLRNGHFSRVNFPNAFDTLVQGVNDDGVLVGIFHDRHFVLHSFRATPLN
jgi:probable HAF family extracellular repeat protein